MSDVKTPPADNAATDKEANAMSKLQKKLEEANAKNQELESKLTRAEKVVSEQNKQIKALEKTKGNKNPLVVHKTGNYQVLCGVRHDGKLYTPKEIAENAALIDELIEKQVKVLQKVG